jgi:hypothetical protein
VPVVAEVLAEPSVPAVTWVPVDAAGLPPVDRTPVSPRSLHATRSAAEQKRRARAREVGIIVTTALLERASEELR